MKDDKNMQVSEASEGRKLNSNSFLLYKTGREVAVSWVFATHMTRMQLSSYIIASIWMH